MFWPPEDTIFIGFPCSGHQNIGILKFSTSSGNKKTRFSYVLHALATRTSEFFNFLFVLATRRHNFHSFSMFWPPDPCSGHQNIGILRFSICSGHPKTRFFIVFPCSGHQKIGNLRFSICSGHQKTRFSWVFPCPGHQRIGI